MARQTETKRLENTVNDMADTIHRLRHAVSGVYNPELLNRVDAIIAAGLDLYGDDIHQDHDIWQSHSPSVY